MKASASKILSAVEANPNASHQHELNGVSDFKRVLGLERFKVSAMFATADGMVMDTAFVTWYDSREAHETRSEYRLYFQSNRVMDLAKEGDTVIVEADGINSLRVVLVRV